MLCYKSKLHHCLSVTHFIVVILLLSFYSATTKAETFAFSIEAMPLSSALDQVSKQSGYPILVEKTLLQGFTSTAFKGKSSIHQVMTHLLSPTGLGWKISADRSVIIRSTTLDNTMILSPVNVSTSVTNSEKDAAILSAGSSSVINQQEIARFRGTSIGDIFQGESGVLVSENRNSGGLDINIRGMQGQGRVPVLLDGSRQETTVYRGYAGVSSRTYIDPDLISSIRIDKGPTMNAHGTGATGGLVSMRTISAEDILNPDTESVTNNTFGFRIRGSLIGNSSAKRAKPGTKAGLPRGSNSSDGYYWVDCVAASMCEGSRSIENAKGAQNSMSRPETFDLRSWSGSIAVAKQFEMLDIVAAYAQRQQGNYYAGKSGPTPYLDLSERYNKGFYTEVRPKLKGASRFRSEEAIVNSDMRSRSWLLKSLIYLPNDQSLEVSWQRYRSEFSQLMPSQLRWFGSIEQTKGSDVTVNTYTSRYRWDPIESELFDVKVNIWNTNTDSINRNYSESMQNPFFSAGDGEKESYNRWGSELTNVMRLLTDRLNISYGATWQKEDIATKSKKNRRSTSGRNGERKEYSLFINTHLKPTQNITIDAGVRYNKFSVTDERLINITKNSPYCTDKNKDGKCDPRAHKNNYSGYAPLASVQYEPWKGIQLYLRYAEALRMPSLFESTSGFSTMPSFDINLKPEHTRNKEVGLNILKSKLASTNDKLSFKLSIFKNHTKDYLTRTSPNVWEKDPNIDFFVTRNIDSVEVQGKELLIQYDAGLFYTKLGTTQYDKIEVCHFGSYRRERCNNYGVSDSYFNNMIPPNRNTTVTLGSRIFKRKLDFGVRGTFMGLRNRTPEYNDDTKSSFLQVIPWHKYKIYDFYARYKHSHNFSIELNIDNLTDQYYLDALSLGLVPAPGRTARISMTLNH